MPTDEDSVGRTTYEGLVRLTFLCGRGLEPEELARRFLVAMRPSVPAVGMWLYQGGRIIAADAERGVREPVLPAEPPGGLMPVVAENGEVLAAVLPRMTLVCRLAEGPVQRAADVVALVARVIALAWQAEMVARDEPWDDDYLSAKIAFKRRWLRCLLRRANGSVTVASRAAGLSRGSLYAMMAQVGLRTEDVTAQSADAGDGESPGTSKFRRSPETPPT